MRVLFTKEGPAIWSSHLDLMRALMRAFRRAGIDLKHSQGYSPHPELSILMPLSVGVESACELAEFTLAEGCAVPAEELAPRLNAVFPAGLRALESYEGGQKAGKLAWLRARLELAYASQVVRRESPGDEEEGSRAAQIDRVEALRELFARPSLIVEKRSKKGDVEMDIAPMIRELRVGTSAACPSSSVFIEAVVSAQNPTLNPLLLATAIETCLPQCKPEHVTCRRLALYDAELHPFR